METSLFLAKVLGLFLLIAGFSILVRGRDFIQSLADFFQNKALIMYSGVLALGVGILILVSHPVWELNWRGLITLIGLLCVFKGAVRLFAPADAERFALQVLKQPWYRILLVFCVLLGAYLSWVGFSVQ